MSEPQVQAELEGQRLRRFTTRVLEDLRALQEMLDGGAVESGVRRIGAEQELVLVDEHGRPAPRNMAILEDIEDERVVTELGRYNLECNLDPMRFEGDCLSRMEDQLAGLLERVQEAAEGHGADLLLTGILPTLRKSDLTLDNMTPKERYRALNEALNRLRGRPYEFYIKGADELLVQHDNVMLESANTSFQVHFQVDRDEFARLYNIAQVTTAPVLAASVYSPLLFGRRLWKETRIALFRQALETRSASPHLRESRPRVHFGRRWVEDSVLEIFREDFARFPVLMTADVEEEPFAKIGRGEAPDLKALTLFNGTVYRWNRPCYGISDGQPHLRIENRVLPSGPTSLDEMANATFWLGLMSGMADRYEDVREVFDFDDVRRNFFAAAQLGLDAQFTWEGGETMRAADLVAEQLLPLARKGLESSGISLQDADRYLSVIRERVETGRTGSDWILVSLAEMRKSGEDDDAAAAEQRLTAVTLGAVKRQKTGRPVHEWETARLEEAGGWPATYQRVEQFMDTDVLAVNEEEPLDLVVEIMEWHDVKYVPIEDREERLVGLVTRSLVDRVLEERGHGEAGDDAGDADDPIPVYEVMERDIVAISPETATAEAIGLMNDREVGCLPVVSEGRLVGLVTGDQLASVAAHLFEEAAPQEPAPAQGEEAESPKD